MPFFSKVFKGKDSSGQSSKNKKVSQQQATPTPAPQPRYEQPWLRKDVEAEEVQELLRGCTQELKARALNTPFFLLPFRPSTEASSARSFLRNFFHSPSEKGGRLTGELLRQELRLTEPAVLASVMKWCWSRLPGGVVTWEAYELFRVGEQDANMARDAFATFIPISVESDARTKIIFDFFDLMAAVAAHGKANGFGGRKLSRYAGWWAFEQHGDASTGFDGGYRAWTSAADATSHLFFAYLRSLTPDSVRGVNGVATLPLSLQSLVEATEYPPQSPALLRTSTTKVVMIVDVVSPTPFALLRRARNFEYRDDDRVLQDLAEFDDPVYALTDENRRVLQSISSTNESGIMTAKTPSQPGGDWSRFQDMGFTSLAEGEEEQDDSMAPSFSSRTGPRGMRGMPMSRTNFARPTTPSWADFLSSGFVDGMDNKGPAILSLPPDKMLPPISTSRIHSSQSNGNMTDGGESMLEPGELASITKLELDDAFWWVWMSSLAAEEPAERKSTFGRCALIETNIAEGRWLVMEEQVKGAAPEPEEGAYVVEKKSRFGLSKRTRKARRESAKHLAPPPIPPYKQARSAAESRANLGPDQHARIHAAAAALQERQKQQAALRTPPVEQRGRFGDNASVKTASVFTLQPVILSEAAPAMKWANSYDKDAIRRQYLGDNYAGRGHSREVLAQNDKKAAAESHTAQPTKESEVMREKELAKERDLPALPVDQLTPPPIEEHPALRQDREVIENGPKPGASQPTFQTRTAAMLAPEKSQPATGAPTPSTRSKSHSPALKPSDQEKNSRPAPEVTNIPPITFPTQQLDRKPVAAPQPPQPQPRSFTPEPTEAAINSSPTATSPTSPGKKQAHKLQKRNPPTGLKKLFGKNKSAAPENTLAAQPAKPKASAGLQVPEDKGSLGKRLSFRKKSPPVVSPLGQTPLAEMAANPIDQSTPTQEHVDGPAPEAFERPMPPQDDAKSVSVADSMEERRADREFRTFDQGPLSDMPAFIPVEGNDEHRHADTLTIDSDAQDEEAAAPVLQKPVMPASEEQGELTRQTSPSQDRWAQIRKNAADRAAARQSEEQSRPSRQSVTTERTEDGETSGEETIESRVARIKARVAELTGGVEHNHVARV